MKDLNLKSLVPHLVAVVVFVILTLGYFSPIMEGYEIRQPDIVNYKGMAKEIQDFRNETGEEALWTNSMFGGMPGYQIDVKNNTNILSIIDKILQFGFSGVVGREGREPVRSHSHRLPPFYGLPNPVLYRAS